MAVARAPGDETRQGKIDRTAARLVGDGQSTRHTVVLPHSRGGVEEKTRRTPSDQRPSTEGVVKLQHCSAEHGIAVDK